MLDEKFKKTNPNPAPESTDEDIDECLYCSY